jgi:hypothetical protein
MADRMPIVWRRGKRIVAPVFIERGVRLRGIRAEYPNKLLNAGHNERFLAELCTLLRTNAEKPEGRKGAMRIGMECHPCEQWLMRVTGPFLAE